MDENQKKSLELAIEQIDKTFGKATYNFNLSCRPHLEEPYREVVIHT